MYININIKIFAFLLKGERKKNIEDILYRDNVNGLFLRYITFVFTFYLELSFSHFLLPL